ncbi:carboxypeptidase-like regulatory domain-containing protein [Psychroserpens sp.]|uniref:carboxypeptidase-like regulatory domain-containing protein n=1 Tax=Psychroserpens sp. TaxID=2020870 RepID=UPI001AFEEFE0|nr:carboxypeptidase-like regulatory domain-containing protein [Psychroserpens sp.]MBO6607717.1 carboxypeptidase-like regulatory domain-containing protein [Psychroserpens sp.]MBO6630923.1 carboxypeptidase-like regulatory domain-containing protein [Psychroserpens sp.]MBO6654708.1 carboxypeptidase-like regulatory domain-containing protein [Psychroserpens sp.]MBO6682868.1 carboxypeptidase-like regulatory domain-containing protein [Psychroserpens sp.]MBO6751075.1 carboxypeptidase-like regulatory do
MRLNRLLVFAFFLIFTYGWSQSIRGAVYDAKTNLPIETAAIYFDNTTIGTTSNQQGEFEIDLRESVNAPLIISFLGYEKVIITDYKPSIRYKVMLNPVTSQLDEVYITTFDGMPKEIKIKHFREHFLGDTKNGRSCEILNEDDLILTYSKRNKQLTARSFKPIIVRNESLGYLVTYEIQDFVITYGNVDLRVNRFRPKSVFYQGTTYFQELDNEPNRKYKKQRKKTYKGSVLHFMRAISEQRLKKEGYVLYSSGLPIDPDSYIRVTNIDSINSYDVKIRAPLSILYDKKFQTEIIPIANNRKGKRIDPNEHIITDADSLKAKLYLVPIKQKEVVKRDFFNIDFRIDQFGNHSPIDAFFFIGYMGDLRIGDMLPNDYNYQEDK